MHKEPISVKIMNRLLKGEKSFEAGFSKLVLSIFLFGILGAGVSSGNFTRLGNWIADKVYPPHENVCSVMDNNCPGYNIKDDSNYGIVYILDISGSMPGLLCEVVEAFHLDD